MAMQRNNIARLPWEIRAIVCRLRFDGAGNAAIAAAVQDACRAAALPVPKIHGTSILAYCGGPEYSQYCEHRKGWDERMRPKRWAASMLHSGAGPQDVADLAELEILEQLHDLAAGGLLATGRDVATVARAITSLQRTQLARRQEAADARLADLAERHAAEIAQLQHEIAGRDAAIATLREALSRAGIDPDAESADKAGGLSAAALRQIEEQAKLL